MKGGKKMLNIARLKRINKKLVKLQIKKEKLIEKLEKQQQTINNILFTN